MNLLIVVDDVDAFREGSEVRARILEQAASLDHLLVIVPTLRTAAIETQRVSETIVIAPTRSWLRWLAVWDALVIAQREFFFQGRMQADLVAALDPHFAGLIALAIAKRYRKPLHVRIERNVWARGALGGMRVYIAQWIVRSAHALLADSEGTKAAIEAVAPGAGERTTVVARFLDIEAIHNAPVRTDLRAKYPQFKFIMLTALSDDASQSFTRAVDVLAKVLPYYRYAGLVIAGTGVSASAVQSYAQGLGVGAHVAVENDMADFLSYTKSAHIFFLTEAFEDRDNIIAQALACGCPAITTPIGVAPAVITDGVGGYICPAGGEVGCWVGHIVRLLNNSTLRTSLAFGARGLLQTTVGGNPEDYAQSVQASWRMAIANANSDTTPITLVPGSSK